MKNGKREKRDVKKAAANDKEPAAAPGEAVSAAAVVPGVMKELKDAAAKARKRKGVFETTEKRVVQAKYHFTDSEKKEMAEKMAQRQQELIEKEDEKKTVMATFTDALKRIKLDISKLSRGYRDGWEHRDYNCVVMYDYKKREVQYKEMATGNIVSSHPFAPGDDQRRWI